MQVLAHDRIGAGAPLVCLHPVGLDRTCWDAFARHCPTGLELIRVDLAGHGASPDRPPEMEIADDAEAVATLLRGLGVDHYAVIGVSFGGMIAQMLAVQEPKAVTAVIAGACPPGISPENRAALAARGRPALQGGMATIADAMMDRWFSNTFRGTADAQAVRTRLLSDKPENWANAWGTISRFDLRDRLDEIRAPVLCLAGGDDVATPRPAMQAIAEGVPNGRLDILEDAPHMLHIECSEAVAARVAAFLVALPSRP